MARAASQPPEISPAERNPLAACPGGKYVDAAAIAHPLVWVGAEAPLHRFEGDERVFIPLDYAIGWVRGEIRRRGPGELPEWLAGYRRGSLADILEVLELFAGCACPDCPLPDADIDNGVGEDLSDDDDRPWE